MAVQAPVNVEKSRKARMSTINSFSNTLVITTKFDGILLPHNVHKMKFSIKTSSVNMTKSPVRYGFSQLLKICLMENFIFCALEERT